MKKELKTYAQKILSDHNCNEYSYGGVQPEQILRDLKEAYPDGMEFPYVDVANAIMTISKMQPIKRSEWAVLWDTDSCSDGYDCSSLGAAKAAAEDTLVEWMCQARSEWQDVFHPTEEELDDYNYMIWNSGARVGKYNPDTDEYDDYWYPDEEELGWKELTMEDIAEEEKAVRAGLTSASAGDTISQKE